MRIGTFTTKTYSRVKHLTVHRWKTPITSRSLHTKNKLRLIKNVKKNESCFVYSCISVITRGCRLIPFEYSVRDEGNVRMLWALRHVPRTATREMNLSRHLCAVLAITDTSSSILFPCPQPYSAHNRHEHVQWRLPITAFGGGGRMECATDKYACRTCYIPTLSPFEQLVLHNNDPHTPRPSNLIRERVISSACNV